jgi:hypothetical protein
MSSFYIHPKTGHLVDADRGIVYKKNCKAGLEPLGMAVNNAGYLVVATGTRKERYTSTVHRMIYEAVTGALVPKGANVHHKNHYRLDNRISNLEVVTPSENQKAGAKFRKAEEEAAKLDGLTKLKIWDTAGVVTAGEWAEDLSVDPSTIERVRSVAVIDVPASQMLQ